MGSNDKKTIAAKKPRRDLTVNYPFELKMQPYHAKFQ
jgi:hypothetical protein